MTEVLGSQTYTYVPTVAGSSVMLTDGTVLAVTANTTTSRPAAGNTGNLFIDTTLAAIFRDNGSSWTEIGSNLTLTGTTNQIAVTQIAGAATLALTNDIVIPGNAGFTPPSGTTAQRPASPNVGQTRWNSTLGYEELYNGTVWQPIGRLLQCVTGNIAQSSGSISGTNRWTYGSTAPTSSQGLQIWTQSFTPISASSRLTIRCSLSYAYASASSIIYLVIYNGTTPIGMTIDTSSATSGNPGNIDIDVTIPSPGTAAITLSARIGTSSGSGTLTMYWNQAATALPSVMVTQYEIAEVL